MTLDVNGYVRSLLGVEEAIFNLMPIAQLLNVPGETLSQLYKSWRNEDEQLAIILKHRENSHDLASLRRDLKDSEQRGETNLFIIILNILTHILLFMKFA